MLLQSNKLRLLIIASLLVVTLGCSASSTPSPIPPTIAPTQISPSAARTSVPSGWKTFTSPEHHYSIAYPADWEVNPAAEKMSGSLPHVGDDIADTLRSSHIGIGAGVLLITSKELSEGTTLEGWTSSIIDHWRNEGGCNVTTRESLQVGGEPAAFLLLSPCLAYYTLTVDLIHGHSGFVTIWFSNPGSEVKDKATFEQILSTLTFPKLIPF